MTTKEICEKCNSRLIFMTLPRPELGPLSVLMGYYCPNCDADLIKQAKKKINKKGLSLQEPFSCYVFSLY